MDNAFLEAAASDINDIDIAIMQEDPNFLNDVCDMSEDDFYYVMDTVNNKFSSVLDNEDIDDDVESSMDNIDVVDADVIEDEEIESDYTDSDGELIDKVCLL